MEPAPPSAAWGSASSIPASLSYETPPTVLTAALSEETSAPGSAWVPAAEASALVSVLAAALDGFVAAATADDAEREHFKEREEAEVAEMAEVLLPSGAFCQDSECPFDDGLALEKVFRGHRHEFVIGREVVLEVDHVAFEVVGVAEKYEFHCVSWLDLIGLSLKLAFLAQFVIFWNLLARG